MEEQQIVDQESITLQEAEKLIQQRDQICELVTKDYQRLVKQKKYELPEELLSIICQEMPVSADQVNSTVERDISIGQVARPRVTEAQLKKAMDQYIESEAWITKEHSIGDILLDTASFLKKKQCSHQNLKRVLKEASRVLAINSCLLKDRLEGKVKKPQDQQILDKLKRIYDYEYELMGKYYPGQQEALFKYLTSRQEISGQKGEQSQSDIYDQSC